MARYLHVDGRSGRLGKFGWLAFMVVGVALIVVLYSIKTQALAAKKQVRHLESVLVQKHAETKLLEAERAHLQSPERLRKLAKDHLGLEPVKAKQVLTLEQAAAQLPKRETREQ